MSLKTIGKLGKDAKSLDGVTNMLEFIRSGSSTKSQQNAFKSIKDSLKGLDVTEASKKLKDLKINPSLATELLDAASSAKILTGSTDEISDGIKKMGVEAAESTGTLGDAFKGLPSLLDSFAIKATLAVAGTALLFKGIQALSDKYNLSYDSAYKNTSESLGKYQSEKTNLESLNSELETTQSRIKELQALKSAGTITLAESAELTKLESQNSQLERQITLKEKLMNYSQKEAALNAKDALGRGEQSIAQQVAQDVPGGKRTYQGDVDNKNVVDAVKDNVRDIKEYEDAIIKLEKKQLKLDPDSKKWKNAQKDIDSYNTAIKELTADIDTKTPELQTLLESFSKSGDGAEALSRYEKQFEEVQSALNSINNIDLSTTEQQFKAIESAFSGKSAEGIKKHFLDLANEGKLTEDSFKSLGITASSIGADNLEQVVRYFNDMKTSAEDAANAIEEIDGSLAGVEGASESVNKGDSLVKAFEHIQKSQELFKQGLTGTDDFKTVEKMITQGTGKDYQTIYNELQKYLTLDDDGNLTRSGISNFVSDFENLGGQFKNTAQAAHALGMSTQMFEMFMGRVSDYDGFENAEQSFENMVKTSEQIGEAKERLQSLQEVYDSLDSGKEKETLKLKMDGWEGQINNAENDLSNLPDEVVTELKFEYDRSQLKKMSEDAQNAAKDTGNKDVVSNANAITTARSYNTHLEDGINIDSLDKTTIPVYFDTEGAIANLESQLHSGTLSEEQTLKVQAEIANLYDLQNSIMETFYDTHPEITPGTEEATNTFTEWAVSVEGQKIIAKMTANTEDAKEKIAEILGIDVEDVSIDVDANDKASDKINSVYAELMGLPEEKVAELIANDNASDSVIGVMSAISGIPVETLTQVNASDGATGVLTTVLSTILGIPQEKVSAILAEDGASGIANMAKSAINSVPGSKNSNLTASGNAQSQANAAKGAINSIPSSKKSVITITTIRETINKVVNKVSSFFGGGKGGDTEANGTAHVGGTAYANGSIKRDIPDDVFSNEKYRTDKSQKGVLIGELSPEMRVDPKTNTWELMGQNGAEFRNVPKDSIVFNHIQTKKLLENGHINSRGTARVTGTAFASGGIVGNITDLNRPSSKKNKDNEDNSFSEIFDHIEIWLNRLDRTLENLKDSIGDYTEDLSKQNAIAQDAINQTKGSLSTLQSAYETYMAQANAVGLEDNWKGVVDSGEIRISEITDEDLKQRIEDYQKYLEDANNISDKIAEYQRDLLDLAQEKLSNIENYYQNRSDYNEDFGYSTDIDELKKALKEYQNELGNQMDSGVIKQGSDAWFQAQKTIAEYLSNILEATWNKLEYVIDGLDRVSDKLDNVSSLEEAKGNKLTEKDYQTQIDTNNKSIQAQYNLRDSYKDQMAIYDVDSKQYQDLAEKIAQCDDEIFKLREDNEDLKDSIWDVRFTQPLDKLKDKYSAIIDEADKFRDLMDSDSFVAKDGSLTSNGLANIAMIMQGMNASKQITSDYTASLKKLDEALKNNIISQSEYDEQQKDILDTINDSVGTTENYKNELIDIYKEMAQAEVASQNKMIDKQKEYMNTQKDAYEYSKKIQSQSKSANQLRAQIAALEGVSNQSAQAELKRLKQQLAEQEDEITETKKDHEYTVRIDGLDSISDSLTEALDTTLDEIIHNAEKQESVVKEMLGHVLNAYGTTYDKINSMIKDTGFQFGNDNSTNIGNIGTGNGANDQYNQATTPQPNVKPSDTITDINTGGVNNKPNIDDIITDISKPIDTTNRKVAELKLNRESMSIQEGSSGSLSVSIRPTDAKNKAVIWTSSNPTVATVSDGSVNAKKHGSTTITVATTDGSGLSASCGVNVTEKPKPKPPAPPSGGSGGDGNPRVGDACTLNGSYFYDSWGTSPAGNRYSGVPGGVVIDGYSASKYGGGARYTGGYDVHIKGADGRYGDLGWVRLDQLSGYASGTRNATAGLHQVDELGNELKLKTIEHNGRKYTMFDAGDQVFRANMSNNLFDFGNNPTAFIANNMPTIPDFSGNVGGGNLNIHYDKLIEVIGNVDKDSLPELKEIISQAVSATKAEILKSYNNHN